MNDVARISRAKRSRKAPATPCEEQGRATSRSRRPSQKYFAFLSYSHRDEELAEWLHRELEDFRVPTSLAGKLGENGVIPRRLSPVFHDKQELAAAKDLGEKIHNALANTQFLIVLCSPEAARSRWTNAEIEYFKRVRPEGCVLAAITAGEPFASEIKGRRDEECFPPALRQKFDRLGRPTGRKAEPLAADLRGEGDDRRIGFLKLVAGMLGVGLDELIQRDTTRRHRRMAWITVASLIGMIVAIGLAVTAIQARDAARDQRRQAEGLVEFMLGDLKDKLEPIGRLDVLDGLGSRVLAYYSKQDTSQLSDQGLAQRSQALTLMGTIADNRGNLDAASRLFRLAMAGTQEALTRDPGNPQRIFDHAQNVFYLGDLARRRGQINEADADYSEYKRLADRLTAIEPDNVKWKLEAAYGNSNVGISLRNRRQFPEAADRFRNAVAVMQGLVSLDPANNEYQGALANTLGWLADSERDLGHLDAAIRIRQQQIAFILQRLAGESENASIRARIVPAYQGLAILLIARGKVEDGIRQLRLAIDQSDHLLSTEPGNTTWRGHGAQARLQLSETLASLKRQSEAEAQMRAACDWSAQVLAHDAKAEWRHLQTWCLAIRSRLALNSGAKIDALDLAMRALAAAKTERNEDPLKSRFAIAETYLRLGDIRQSMGDLAGAREAWAAGFAQLPEGVAERPGEMSERADLLRRLGRANEARPILDRLAAIQFRSIS